MCPRTPFPGRPPFWTLIFRGGANEWRYWSKSKTQKQKAEKIRWAPGLTRRPEGGAGRGRPWGWCCPRAVCFQPLLCKGPCLGRVCIAWGRRRSAFGPIAAAFRAQAPGLPSRASEWSHHPGSGAPGLGHLAVRWQRLQASHILVRRRLAPRPLRQPGGELLWELPGPGQRLLRLLPAALRACCGLCAASDLRS